jgi:hypothetical protein
MSFIRSQIFVDLLKLLLGVLVIGVLIALIFA